ncbi:MAG: hypothetical protein Q8S27_20035, partial [Hoeflea sp.]|nr:hypothetical protein [Hoeflea sp.]
MNLAEWLVRTARRHPERPALFSGEDPVATYGDFARHAAQIGAGLRERTLDGRTPRQQVTECHAVIRELETRKERTYLTILGLLE